MATNGRTSGGLYGSDTAGSAIRAATAEVIGTFILVLAGIAVATGAIRHRPTAGASSDSLAVALAFGLTLVPIVTALAHVSGRTSTRRSRSG